jgi:hypothetical protein
MDSSVWITSQLGPTSLGSILSSVHFDESYFGEDYFIREKVMHWGLAVRFCGFLGTDWMGKMDVILSAHGLDYTHPCEQWFFLPLQFYTVAQVTIIHKNI